MNDVLSAVKDLEDFHGKALTLDARVYYVEALEKLPTALVVSGLDLWKQNNSPSSRLPSLNQLRACIDDARVAAWRKSAAQPMGPAANSRQARQAAATSDPTYRNACWDLVRSAWGMSKHQLADAFDHMHSLWPGHDWDKAAERARVRLAVSPPTLVDTNPRAPEDQRRASLAYQGELVKVGTVVEEMA